RDGDYVAVFNQRTGKQQYRQAYDAESGTIQFDFGMPLMLKRRSDANAIGYFPRSTVLAPYTYRAPLTRDDGWKTTSAQRAGMSESALRDIVRRLATANPLNDTMPRIHGLVVARLGALVLDEYFYGDGAEDLHDLRSASKTMTSVMAGAAMLRGAMLYGAKFDMSSPIDTATTLNGINVGHLLTHSSGLACNDDDENSPGNEERMQAQTATDWYRYTLNISRVHPAGTVYAYCSGGINLVGRAISAATKQWLPAFFDRTIARPLQITHYAVNLMPSGDAYSAGGMRMRARDFLKFGQLYLNGGVWNGTRIVSADWVRTSTARQIDRPDGSTDGFGWHRHVLHVGTHAYQTYEASGNGGQFVVVIPELDLAIATTAGNYGQYNVWEKIRTMLVPDIMRAVR
ncbi:MAG: serine hydrolase, partial [Gemmatimonadaceae bacterium]